MRPEVLKAKIQLAIDKFLLDREATRLTHLKPYAGHMMKMWLKMCKEEGVMHLQVDESFAQSIIADAEQDDAKRKDFQESLYNQMMYISDRWKCSHRLGWLIEGIQKDIFIKFFPGDTDGSSEHS